MQTTINWNLETIFEEGIKGEAFADTLAQLTQKVDALLTRSKTLAPLGEDDEAWASILLKMDAIEPEISNCWAYTHCVSCADTNNAHAARMESRVAEVWGRMIQARVPVENGLANAKIDLFNQLLAREDLAGIREGLKNIRRQGYLLLPLEQQALSEELSQNGLHAWSQLYTRQSGKVQVDIDGEKLSASQAFNRFSGSKNAEERTRVFRATGQAWSEDRDLWATILNHLTGTRMSLNARRQCGPLEDVLSGARMTRESLDAMHSAIEMFRVELLPYLSSKAQLLGLEQLGWQDLRAPISGASVSHSWEDSVSFVLTHFKTAQDPLFQLAKTAFEESWIEAEDRPYKRAGGWCTSIPKLRQSRIFMTHGGSFNSTVTLAHELGHAYHNSVLWGLPTSNRRVPMTLAETASVFAENVVRDAALESAQSTGQQLGMLDARLRSAVSFLMDIPTRFDFESGLYELRAQGEFSADDLDELMVTSQKKNFCNSLREWNPSFWCSKLHFYMSRRSFYNFPYSFGYLFSSLVYALAKREGAGFQARYVRLLQETGWRTAEDISQDHLGLDLQDPKTWLLAMEPIRKDLKAFSELA
jgi:oligoendopeptidase F